MSTASFILRRLGSSLVAIAGVSVLVFLLLHLIPGDPIDQLTGGEATPKQRQALEECMHLDKSLGKQFTLFLGTIADGSLGRQCPNPDKKPTVMDRIVKKLPYTIELALGGMLVAILLSLPLGILAAVKRGTWIDTASAVISLSGLSMHTAFMGPLALVIFFDQLSWLPGPAEADARFALVLPSLVIGSHLMAMLARMTRSSLVEVLDNDYIRTARAKGLSDKVVLLKHALRNALMPVITVAGLQFGSLLGGAIITEKIFERPGLGTLLLEGINERNYPVVQGTVLVIALSYVIVNTLVDLSYGLIDPRVRHRS